MTRSSEDSNAPSIKPTYTNQDLPNTVPQELIDYTLNFLSTSSNETLLGVFSLLILLTYIILGRIGLLLIGVAVGVVLHASWEGSDHEHAGEASHTNKSNRRRELALEVSHRLLDWPKRVVASDNQNDNDGPISSPEDLSLADLEYATFQPATAGALRTLTDAVIKDYVK